MKTTTRTALLIVGGVAAASAGWSVLGAPPDAAAVDECKRAAEVLKIPGEATSTTITDSREAAGGWAVKGKHVGAGGTVERYWECSTATGHATITWWGQSA